MKAEDILYKQAIKDVKGLAQDVMDQCKAFADEYCYDIEWVLDKFQEEFAKEKRNL